MKTALRVYETEIIRTFALYGVDRGFDQNVSNIVKWYMSGLLTDSAYKHLRKYNRVLYSEIIQTDK